MRVLVTGAGGFLGGHLARSLKGHDVSAFTRKDCDLTSREATVTAFAAARPEAVVHAAGSLLSADPKTGYWNNVLGAAHAVEAAVLAGASKFVFLSSNSVYGDSYSIGPAEADSADPKNWYGGSKLIGEMLLRDQSAVLDGVVLRIPAVVGEGKTSGRDLISTILRAFDAGEPFVAFGTGAARRQLLIVEDVIAAVESCLKRPAGRGFLRVPVAGPARTIKEIAERLSSARAGQVRFDASRRETPDQWVDPAIAVGRLGLRLSSGLDQWIAASGSASRTA